MPVDLSETLGVTGVTLSLGNWRRYSPRRACHAFEACYACLGRSWQASQYSGPAVAPWRISQDGGNGIGGVADNDAAVFSLDAIAA